MTLLRFPRGLTFVGLLAGTLLGACDDASAPNGERMFGVTPVPGVVRVAVGETVAVTLVPFDSPPGATDGRIVSRSVQPTIAAADTIVALGKAFVIRGVAVGETSVQYDVTAGGQRVTGSLPVTIVARP